MGRDIVEGFRVHPKSVAKMKNRVRELTNRNKGISNEIRENKYRMLRALKLEHCKAMELAMNRKKNWRMSIVLGTVITNKIIAKLGYISMLDYYLTVCEN